MDSRSELDLFSFCLHAHRMTVAVQTYNVAPVLPAETLHYLQVARSYGNLFPDREFENL